MPWTFFDSSGRKLNTSSTSVADLDIDGATDIGAAIVDADLFIIDDGAGGTNRKTAASRIATYVNASSAVTREGGNTTEATTTSTSAVDLLSATSLTLDAITPYCLIFGSRKTSGAVDDGGVGFKENSTVILEAAGGSNILWRANTTNEAQEGGIFEFVSARQTNYLNGNMYGGSVTMGTGGQARENRSGPATDYTASHVNAQTTSFILRGIMDNASNTLAVDELHLYPFATS